MKSLQNKIREQLLVIMDQIEIGRDFKYLQGYGKALYNLYYTMPDCTELDNESHRWLSEVEDVLNCVTRNRSKPDAQLLT